MYIIDPAVVQYPEVLGWEFGLFGGSEFWFGNKEIFHFWKPLDTVSNGVDFQTFKICAPLQKRGDIP